MEGDLTMKKGYENVERLVIEKHGCKFSFQGARFYHAFTHRPIANAEELKESLKYGDILNVSLVLNEAPCSKWERAARKLDGKYYDPMCFSLQGYIGYDVDKNRVYNVWDVIYVGKDYELVLQHNWNLEEAGQYAWFAYDLFCKENDIEFTMD